MERLAIVSFNVINVLCISIFNRFEWEQIEVGKFKWDKIQIANVLG